MLVGKRFGLNEVVIIETEAYLEAKYKKIYMTGIEKLELAGLNVSLLKETMLLNKEELFLIKNAILVVSPGTY